MNFDKSWVMNYSSSLREKEKTSIICVANLHSPQWNITSKAHKIRTTLKRRWIFKRASGNRCLHDAGKTRPPRKAAAAAAAAAAIPCQYIRGQKSNYRKEKNRSRGENLDYNSCMTYVEKTLRCYISSSIVNGGVYKIQKFNWKENSRVRIGRIAFTAEASNLEVGRYSCNPKTISRLFHPGMTNYAKIFYKWIEHEIITLLQELDWKLYGEWAHSYRRKTHISSTIGGVYPLPWRRFNLSRQQCQRSRSNCRYKRNRARWIIKFVDDLRIESTCPQRRNEFLDTVWAIIMYQSLLWKNAL